MASVRIQCGLFGILCLLSTLSKADAMEMYTVPKVLAQCGWNLTLNCDITAKGALDIKRFLWMEKKEICEYTQKIQNGTDFECRRLSYTYPAGKIYNYSLTIFNIQPKHKGTYHCKLGSKEGTMNGKTILRVQNCAGNSSTSVSTTVGSCTFKDVYPEPIIFWNQGYDNLTHLAETTVTLNETTGLYTAVSTLKLKKDPSIPYHYNCSLFLNLDNEKNETKVEWVRSLSFSDGHKVIGQWFGVMLAMVFGMILV
ncbi:hypothetical protein NL108_013883 [Boleophthalmus pectinirostris]|uniref:uncharacterized protein LOC110160618 n=1 Tax=Boleophthalmus pectinirostris TaxID=150288 RepID=UPI000A1C4DF7|nr:uncharacterized protein LOC110160618 [Boleophthalmus pectinirostris]KAJ0058397.1 hypothetical protein NL108_013883 [Boleophthalmus pectinirostris]